MRISWRHHPILQEQLGRPAFSAFQRQDVIRHALCIHYRRSRFPVIWIHPSFYGPFPEYLLPVFWAVSLHRSILCCSCRAQIIFCPVPALNPLAVLTVWAGRYADKQQLLLCFPPWPPRGERCRRLLGNIMNCWDIMGENVSGAAHAGQDVPLAYQSWKTWNGRKRFSANRIRLWKLSAAETPLPRCTLDFIVSKAVTISRWKYSRGILPHAMKNTPPKPVFWWINMKGK